MRSAREELYEKTQEIGGAMGDKLQSVALLFGAYDAKLHAGGATRAREWRSCATRWDPRSSLAGKDVYVDGYAYFNRLEEDILSIILRQAHQVTVTLLGEKGNQELFQNALRQPGAAGAHGTRGGRSVRDLLVYRAGAHGARSARALLFRQGRGLAGADGADRAL